MKLTPVFEQVADGYAAYIEEIPEARVLAPTREEAEAKLIAAVQTVLETMRDVVENQ